MSMVSIEMFKKHARIDDYAGDDDYISHLLEAAEESVILATERTRGEIIDLYGGYPAPLRHAVMLLAAHWYNQRESVSTTQMYAVPDSLQSLVKPYCKLA